MELQFLYVLLNPHCLSQPDQIQRTRIALVRDTPEDEDIHLFNVEAPPIQLQLPHVVRFVVIEGRWLLDAAETAELHLLVTPLVKIDHSSIFIYLAMSGSAKIVDSINAKTDFLQVNSNSTSGGTGSVMIEPYFRSQS
jgi:hypothetical protein